VNSDLTQDETVSKKVMVKLYSLDGDSRRKELKWVVETAQVEFDLSLNLVNESK
jgi:hypothetical protein